LLFGSWQFTTGSKNWPTFKYSLENVEDILFLFAEKTGNSITKASKATAARDLQTLLEIGALILLDEGRGAARNTKSICFNQSLRSILIERKTYHSFHPHTNGTPAKQDESCNRFHKR
jgi:hypothetical protein